MVNIRERDFFWKTVSIAIIILLMILFVFGNLVLTANFFISNIFVDQRHPLEAKWDINNMKVGYSPGLIVKYESQAQAREKFYDSLKIPAKWRLSLSFWQVAFLVLVIGLIYVIGISLVASDKDVPSPLIMIPTLICQLLLWIILIACSIGYYQGADPNFINDLELLKSVNDNSIARIFTVIITLFMSFLLTDSIILLLGYFLSDFLTATAKKIKAVIINKLTLGNNIMLCCNNGLLELISIDFELKWIPFPALFLKKRVLERLSVRDGITSKRLRQWLGELSVAIEEEQIKQLTQLNMNGGSLLISHDDSVQIIKLNSALQWRPFPRTVIQQEVLRRVSFDNFFHYLTTESKQLALEQLRGLLVGSYQNRFATLGQTAVSTLVKNFCAKTLEVVKKSLPKITADQSNLASQAANQLLQNLTDEKLRAFKQEIVASIQEALQLKVSQNIREAILGPLQAILAEKLPLVNSNGSIDALPEGTKFFFTSSRRQAVIIEQKPQIRSLYFEKGFAGGSGRYHLALPYVIFLIIFDDLAFHSLYVYYATKPMTSLDSEVFRINLPNIWGENRVCTGSLSFKSRTLAGRVEEVVAHYWQSKFNNDLAATYSEMAHRGGAFSNLASWQAASQKDPLFVLRVNWLACNSYTPNQIVANCMQGGIASRISNFDNLISQALQTEGVNIGAIAKKCCDNIYIDQRYPNKAISALKQQLVMITQNICQAFSEVLSNSLEAPDEQALVAAVSGATAKAVDEVIAQDFARLANQVLLRRRISAQELIDRIINQS